MWSGVMGGRNKKGVLWRGWEIRGRKMECDTAMIYFLKRRAFAVRISLLSLLTDAGA